MRFRALVRYRYRRMRGMVVLLGVGLSSLLLAATIDPALVSGELNCFGGQDLQSYQWFLLLNPPALALEIAIPWFALVEFSFLQPVLFLLSLAWWCSVGVVFRRRHARPLETTLV